MNRLQRVVQILDDSVNNQDIGGHGRFWIGMTRDEFVDHSVFGQRLLEPGDGAGSNLIKALRGEAPFSGSPFRRMPADRDPVSDADIDFIEQWIDDGAPDEVDEGISDILVDMTAGGPAVDPQVHLDYWRDFDNWAMFQATPAVRRDIDAVMGAAPLWMAFARDSSQEDAWKSAIGSSSVLDATLRLADLQAQTVARHYGNPVEFLTVLDSYMRFGDDSLPNDPQRAVDPRHNMNGPTMWFFWSAFADACLRSQALPDVGPFWRAHTRAVLLGLMNDGLFRARFTITGFSADPAGKDGMRAHVQTLPDDQLQAELVKRFSESGF